MELNYSQVDGGWKQNPFGKPDLTQKKIGSLTDFRTFVIDQLNYPEKAVDKKIQGDVTFEFDVEDGMVANAKIIKGLGCGIDDELLRVLNASPEWDEPIGKYYGKFTMNFYLREEGKSVVKGISWDEDRKETADYYIDSAKQIDKNEVYQIVDKMPEFPGGEKALLNYISENIVYPQSAKDKNISGRVFVSFVIEKDGSVSDVKVMRGIDEECDAEAIRVVKAMPKWKPGMDNGKPVKVSYMLPVNFKLTDGEK